MNDELNFDLGQTPIIDTELENARIAVVAGTITLGDVETGEAGTEVEITNTGTPKDAVFNFTIPRGDKGDTGDAGPQGERGEKGDTGDQGPKGDTGSSGADGVSPVITVTEIENGYQISVTDVHGTSVFDVYNGADGQNGQNGADGTDGVSPEVTSTEITGGHRLYIVDARGTTSIDVLDGEDGAAGVPGSPGAPGTDGVSPEVTVTAITGGHRVTITDASGDHVFDVMDGSGGGGSGAIDVIEVNGVVQPIVNKTVNISADANGSAAAVQSALQSQIDALTSRSDVVDVVGTYAELVAYSKTIYEDDIVKVLTDETHNNAISYYRWKTATTSWEYIGSQGPFYTKGETDTLLSGKQPTIADLSDIRNNASAGAAKISCTEAAVAGYGFTKNTGTYSKPSGGIPKTDLASAVQTSLGKADAAIANPASKSSGQVLTYNGSEWEAQTPQGGGMSGTQIPATIPASAWVKSGNYYTATVSVSGIKATYPVAPVVDCVLSGTDAAGDNAILAAFGQIAIIDTAAGSITATAIGSAPAVNVPITINVWE